MPVAAFVAWIKKLQEEQGIYSRPAHLVQESWVDFELRTSLDLLATMQSELARLKIRLLEERVHKSRVAIRRWFSVWGLLCQDGFDSKKFRKKVLSPLKEFLKELGDLRDCDVNIETATKLRCDEQTMEDLKKIRKKLKKAVEKSLKKLDSVKLVSNIETYLLAKAEDLSGKLKSDPGQDNSAFAHFDRYLQTHEALVKKLLAREQSSENLHKLRLAIKKWRYLLTECMGLTNFVLVKSQTLLGEIHDLDRLEPVLEFEHHPDDFPAIVRLKDERRQLLLQFEELKAELPFGLRPGVTSYLVSKQNSSD